MDGTSKRSLLMDRTSEPSLLKGRRGKPSLVVDSTSKPLFMDRTSKTFFVSPGHADGLRAVLNCRLGFRVSVLQPFFSLLNGTNCNCHFSPSEVPRGLTSLVLQSRIGNKPLQSQVFCPQNGTSALQGLMLGCLPKTWFVFTFLYSLFPTRSME